MDYNKYKKLNKQQRENNTKQKQELKIIKDNILNSINNIGFRLIADYLINTKKEE